MKGRYDGQEFSKSFFKRQLSSSARTECISTRLCCTPNGFVNITPQKGTFKIDILNLVYAVPEK
jgi:hypothetical protein